MRTLIASQNDQTAQQVGDLLAHLGVDCPAGHVVGLERANDRASRVVPDLLVLVASADPAEGLQVLREIRSTVPHLHVLVVGPASDPQLILRTLHEGADEYVDAAQLNIELNAAVTRFKARQHAAAPKREAGRIIGLLAPSGGSGSSMLAANISSLLARQHQECGLVDLRLTAGDLTSMLDLKPTYTLADLCDRLSRLDQSMFEQFFVRHSSGVWLLAAPTQLADVPRVTGQGVRRALALARVRFPYVVLDLSNSFDEEQVEALWQSDVILLVLRLDYTSVRNTRRAMDHLVELGIELDRVQLVVNGYGQRQQLRIGQAEEALGKKILHYVPSDPARVNRAINRGVPVSLYYPSAKVTRRIASLASSVNGRHTKK